MAIKDIKKGTLILQETPQCFANASEPSKIDVKRQVLLICHKISDMIYDGKTRHLLAEVFYNVKKQSTVITSKNESKLAF